MKWCFNRAGDALQMQMNSADIQSGAILSSVVLKSIWNQLLHRFTDIQGLCWWSFNTRWHDLGLKMLIIFLKVQILL